MFLTMKGVQELHIGEKTFILTCIVLIIAVVVGYHHLFVEKQEELLTANKCENINSDLHSIVVVYNFYFQYWLKRKLNWRR